MRNVSDRPTNRRYNNMPAMLQSGIKWLMYSCAIIMLAIMAVFVLEDFYPSIKIKKILKVLVAMRLPMGIAWWINSIWWSEQIKIMVLSFYVLAIGLDAGFSIYQFIYELKIMNMFLVWAPFWSMFMGLLFASIYVGIVENLNVLFVNFTARRLYIIFVISIILNDLLLALDFYATGWVLTICGNIIGVVFCLLNMIVCFNMLSRNDEKMSLLGEIGHSPVLSLVFFINVSLGFLFDCSLSLTKTGCYLARIYGIC